MTSSSRTCVRSRSLEVAVAALCLTFVPRALADAGAFDPLRLAPPVAAAIDRDEQRPEGEWGLVTDEMAILGLGQIVLAHPETRERWVPMMEKAAEHMMRPSQRAFATRAWGSDGSTLPNPPNLFLHVRVKRCTACRRSLLGLGTP